MVRDFTRIVKFFVFVTTNWSVEVGKQIASEGIDRVDFEVGQNLMQIRHRENMRVNCLVLFVKLGFAAGTHFDVFVYCCQYDDVGISKTDAAILSHIEL